MRGLVVYKKHTKVWSGGKAWTFTVWNHCEGKSALGGGAIAHSVEAGVFEGAPQTWLLQSVGKSANWNQPLLLLRWNATARWKSATVAMLWAVRSKSRDRKLRRKSNSLSSPHPVKCYSYILWKRVSSQLNTAEIAQQVIDTPAHHSRAQKLGWEPRVIKVCGT